MFATRLLITNLSRICLERSSFFFSPSSCIYSKEQFNRRSIHASIMNNSTHPSQSDRPSTTNPSLPPCNFCRMCGAKMTLLIPPGDDKHRHACMKCSHIEYFNPKIVVGVIIAHNNKVLLTKRGIPPQKGLWTIPAGYQELSESSATGAKREAWEEAAADIEIEAPFCHFDITAIGQTYILFKGRLLPPYTYRAVLPETLDVGLYGEDEVPWDKLAFSSVAIALRAFFDDEEKGRCSLHHGRIERAAGAGPNEAGTFQLVDHMMLDVKR